MTATSCRMLLSTRSVANITDRWTQQHSHLWLLATVLQITVWRWPLSIQVMLLEPVRSDLCCADHTQGHLILFAPIILAPLHVLEHTKLFPTSVPQSILLSAWIAFPLLMGFLSLKGLKLNVTFYLVTHFVTKLFSSYFFKKSHISVCLSAYFNTCVCVFLGMYIYAHVNDPRTSVCQRMIYRSWFSPSTFWIPWIKLRPLGLVASTFTGGVSFSVLSFFFLNNTLHKL